MSNSSYCQGLQSCLEPARLVEPRVLRLKLAPPKSNTSSRCSSARSSKNSFVPDSDGDSKRNNNDNVDTGGWSFLQYLNINSETKKEDVTDEKDKKVYIPPNFKRSSSMLSKKSLEMCTESLGSETGSDGSESSDEMSLLSLENVKSCEEARLRSKSQETRRMTRTVSFPPPLTSISGSSNFQVRPHREGGRLVLEAVSVSSCQANFHAERIDGRLRLHLIPNSNNDEEQEEEEVLNETLVEEDCDGEESGEEEDGNWEEENDGNCEGEMGMEELQRPSRCKESGSGSNRLITWEPFWVAT